MILEAERYIWNNPETGYKEFKTSAYMEEKFTELGYELIKPDGITGFCTVLDTGRPGPELLILGELDSVICPTHPEADPTTGAALSLGTNIEIVDIPGYAPLINDGDMALSAKEACDSLFPELDFRIHSTPSTGSTDMGDLSCVMPTLHPFWAGASGTAHGSDFVISDPETACVKCAAFQLAFAHLLLKDGGARAKEIIAAYKPRFANKEAYLAYTESLNASGDRIEYRADGTATVML